MTKHIHPDSLGPDPYTVAPGFKKLPSYECRLCGEQTSSSKEATQFQDWLGTWDSYKPICNRCADLVESMNDWRVA